MKAYKLVLAILYVACQITGTDYTYVDQANNRGDMDEDNKLGEDHKDVEKYSGASKIKNQDVKDFEQFVRTCGFTPEALKTMSVNEPCFMNSIALLKENLKEGRIYLDNPVLHISESPISVISPHIPIKPKTDNRAVFLIIQVIRYFYHTFKDEIDILKSIEVFETAISISIHSTGHDIVFADKSIDDGIIKEYIKITNEKAFSSYEIYIGRKLFINTLKEFLKEKMQLQKEELLKKRRVEIKKHYLIELKKQTKKVENKTEKIKYENKEIKIDMEEGDKKIKEITDKYRKEKIYTIVKISIFSVVLVIIVVVTIYKLKKGIVLKQ